MDTIDDGLAVEANDRGFTAHLTRSPRPGCGLLLVFIIAFGLGMAALVAVTVASSTELMILATVGLPLVLGGAGFFTLHLVTRRRRGQLGTRITLDGDRLRALAIEGPVNLSLDQIAGIDQVPVGLAIRLRGGGALHIPLAGVQDPGRNWLRTQLHQATLRFGQPDEVPKTLRELRRDDP